MATLTLTNHLRLFDEVFEFLTNLQPDDPPVISDGEILFRKILAYGINKDFVSYIYTGIPVTVMRKFFSIHSI